MITASPRRSRSHSRRNRLTALLAAAMLAPALAPLQAQAVRATAAQGNMTRAEIQAAADSLDRAAGKDKRKAAEAAAFRARLRDGDFAAGDRVVIEVRGDSALFDTLTVRSGPTLRLAGLPDVSLRGVLRSELNGHLTQYLSKYIRQPDVRSESLIRLSMTGQIGKPGYYDFSSDMLFTDAIMAAGGPTAVAALDRSSVRRGSSVIIARGAVASAARNGATLDRIGVRPGDEVEIGEKRKKLNWGTVAAVAGTIASLGFSLAYLLNR